MSVHWFNDVEMSQCFVAFNRVNLRSMIQLFQNEKMFKKMAKMSAATIPVYPPMIDPTKSTKLLITMRRKAVFIVFKKSQPSGVGNLNGDSR